MPRVVNGVPKAAPQAQASRRPTPEGEEEEEDDDELPDLEPQGPQWQSEAQQQRQAPNSQAPRGWQPQPMSRAEGGAIPRVANGMSETVPQAQTPQRATPAQAEEEEDDDDGPPDLEPQGQQGQPEAEQQRPPDRGKSEQQQAPNWQVPRGFQPRPMPRANGGVKFQRYAFDQGAAQSLPPREYDDHDVEFEWDGQLYLSLPNGVLLDPVSRAPVGIWNTETQEVVPIAVVQNGDSSYYFLPDGVLLDSKTLDAVYVMCADGAIIDAETQQLVGMMDPETKTIMPLDGSGGPGADPALADPGLAEVHKHLDTANTYFRQKLYHISAKAYGHALEACEHAKAVDLEFECEIIRKRAACWQHLNKKQELLAEAERILSYDANDAEALEWQKSATQALDSVKAKGVSKTSSKTSLPMAHPELRRYTAGAGANPGGQERGSKQAVRTTANQRVDPKNVDVYALD